MCSKGFIANNFSRNEMNFWLFFALYIFHNDSVVNNYCKSAIDMEYTLPYK